MVSFSWDDLTGTHQKIVKCLIKPHFQAPSRNQHGKLETETATIGSPPLMRSLLKLTKGVVDLPPESVIERVVGKGSELFEDAGHCEMALKIFMYNMKFTIVSPESYYEGCATYCTHQDCNKPLLFEKVNWDTPRLVLGVAEANEVLIPLSYKCAAGHRCKSIDAKYLSQLPTLVQRAYPYSTTSSTVLNSKCAWSLLTPITMEPVHRFVSLTKKTDFSYRIERYLLYAQLVQSKGIKAKFPTPPTELFESSSASRCDSYLCPGPKILRDVRLAGYKQFQPEIQASMKAVKPGKFVAIDSNYENTRKTRTDSTALTAILSKEGEDKGKIMAYGVFVGHESHSKSRALYEGVAARPGYKDAIDVVSADDCCQGTCASNMDNTVIHQVFGAVPRGDVFHKMSLLLDNCSKCALSAEHRADVSQIFFNDALNVTEFTEQYPQWKYLWDHLKLDGSVSDLPPPDLEEHDLYARKLVALAKCLRKEHKKALAGKPEGFCKEFCLNSAIEDVGLSYHRFVPRRFRSKEDMIQKLKEYTLKWFGFSIKVLPTGKVEWDFQDWEEVEPRTVGEEHEELFQAGVAEVGETSALILHRKKLQKGAVRFLDGDGTLWFKATQAQFGKSKMFRPGCDGKILGKPGIQQEVVNLAKHIHKGCFNFFSENHGLEFYSEVGKPITAGKYEGLVKVETAIGTNELEAKFRVTNTSTALTSSLADPELECRVELNFLRQNYGVDKKKGSDVPPTEHYWRWTVLGDLSASITGKRIFKCRNYMEESQEFPPEPHLGFGAYRFHVAAHNGMGYDQAINHALGGFSVKMAKDRFVHRSKHVLYKERSSARNSQKPNVQQGSINPEKPVGGQQNSSPPAANQEQPSQKKTGIRSQPVRKKRVYATKLQVVNKLLPVSSAKTSHQRNLIKEAFCKVVAAKDGSTPSKSDFAEVACDVNKKIIDLRSSPKSKEDASRLKRKFPGLITADGVMDTLHKTGESMNFLAEEPPKKKQRKNRDLSLAETYPLRVEELLQGSGITHKRCSTIIQDMKKRWTKGTCASGKGFAAKFPKGMYCNLQVFHGSGSLSLSSEGTTSTKYSKTILNFGLRRVFEDMDLKCISFDEVTKKFVPVYGSPYYFRTKSANSRHTSKCHGGTLQIVLRTNSSQIGPK